MSRGVTAQRIVAHMMPSFDVGPIYWTRKDQIDLAINIHDGLSQRDVFDFEFGYVLFGRGVSF